MLIYLDSTAVKRLAAADESATALRRYLGENPSLVTCRIVEAEPAAKPVLPAFSMREVDSTLMRGAAELMSGEVDLAAALHLAAAVELRRELDGFVTYDDRNASTARALRLPVVSPT